MVVPQTLLQTAFELARNPRSKVKTLGQQLIGASLITPAQLESAITPKTKVLVLNSPSNPGGHAYTPAELKALAEVVLRHPTLMVFSDEISARAFVDRSLVLAGYRTRARELCVMVLRACASKGSWSGAAMAPTAAAPVDGPALLREVVGSCSQRTVEIGKGIQVVNSEELTP